MKYVLSFPSIDSKVTKFEIFCEHAYLYSRAAVYLGLIRTVYKYRKCSLVTGLIMSLTDLPLGGGWR